MHEASRGPLKGAVSAQKALQGPEAETREMLGGMEENRVSRRRVIDLPYRQINDFFYKKESEKNEFSGQTWARCRSGGTRSGTPILLRRF